MAMSHGHPAAFDLYRAGCRRVGLGVDSPAICSGDMFFTMRLALQEKRVRENASYHARDRLPDVVPATTDEALWMATLGSAAAVHMESEIGSLEVGKFADLVLIRTDSPSMVGALDFSAALVTHCTAGEVDSVMVNGEWVKRDKKLLRVDWDELKVKLQQNRAVLERRWEGVDWDENKSDLKGLWGLGGVLE
jgi:cytosine/adenosine deaminase-related metal-dependent hydrolase